MLFLNTYFTFFEKHDFTLDNCHKNLEKTAKKRFFPNLCIFWKLLEFYLVDECFSFEFFLCFQKSDASVRAENVILTCSKYDFTPDKPTQLHPNSPPGPVSASQSFCTPPLDETPGLCPGLLFFFHLLKVLIYCPKYS